MLKGVYQPDNWTSDLNWYSQKRKEKSTLLGVIMGASAYMGSPGLLLLKQQPAES